MGKTVDYRRMALRVGLLILLLLILYWFFASRLSERQQQETSLQAELTRLE